MNYVAIGALGAVGLFTFGIFVGAELAWRDAVQRFEDEPDWDEPEDGVQPYDPRLRAIVAGVWKPEREVSPEEGEDFRRFLAGTGHALRFSRIVYRGITWNRTDA